MWVAWNLKGAPDLAAWMSMTHFERAVVHDVLETMIEDHNTTITED